MGYELSATMTNGTDIQAFTVAPGRSSMCIVLDAIAQAYPDRMQDDPHSPYRTVTLTAEQGSALFAQWHTDLQTFTGEDGEETEGTGFGTGLDGGWIDVLVGNVAEMHALAQAGYTTTFAPE